MGGGLPTRGPAPKRRIEVFAAKGVGGGSSRLLRRGTGGLFPRGVLLLSLRRRCSSAANTELRGTPSGRSSENASSAYPGEQAFWAAVDNGRWRAYIGGRQQDAKKTPSPRVAPGGGGPTSDYQVLGVNLQLMLAGVGLNSFGPNPTANPAGAEEGGRVAERRSSWSCACGGGPCRSSGGKTCGPGLWSGSTPASCSH